MPKLRPAFKGLPFEKEETQVHFRMLELRLQDVVKRKVQQARKNVKN